jgi:hypothetical protein
MGVAFGKACIFRGVQAQIHAQVAAPSPF